MTGYSSITYHLRELEIALDHQSPFYVMPKFSENDQGASERHVGPNAHPLLDRSDRR